MTDVRKDHDGVDAPTSAAQFFDVAAVLTVLAGVLVAVLLVMGSQEGTPGWPLAVGVAVPCLLSGLLLRGAAVALRWLAAMYQLSAGEATGLLTPPPTIGGPTAQRATHAPPDWQQNWE